MEVKIPEAVNVVELETAPFNNALCARSWALTHGVVGLMSNVDTNGKGERNVDNPINDKLEISVLYGAVSFGGLAFRVKTTLKLYHEPGHPHKAYSYQVCNVEVIKGNEILKGIRRASARPNDRISMSVGILLNGVCDVNGMPLLAAQK